MSQLIDNVLAINHKPWNHREIGRQGPAALDKVGLLVKNERQFPIALSGVSSNGCIARCGASIVRRFC